MKYYVDAKVGQTGDGCQEKPFKTIGEAAAIAVAGDEVIVAPGLYREWVNPKNGGSSSWCSYYWCRKAWWLDRVWWGR